MEQVQEDLHPLVHAVNNFRSKEGVSYKSLVILPLEAANVLQSYVHGLSERTLITQVVPIHLHKVLCVVMEFLHSGNHVNMLV